MSLARPPVIGKDTFTLGTAYPQALLTQEKRAIFLSRAGKVLATETFSMKRRIPRLIAPVEKGDLQSMQDALT
jgi:hypothetical protein